jgi:hypothetical protein
MKTTSAVENIKTPVLVQIGLDPATPDTTRINHHARGGDIFA